jgi:hypothetical protein
MASQSASECVGNFRPLGSKRWKAVYDAPGPNLKNRPNVRFHENLKEMWCDGVVLDIIEGLGGLDGCETRCRSFACRDFGHELAQNQTRRDIGDAGLSMSVVEKVARSLALDRRDKYLRFQAPEHYVSNFIVLCHACLSLSADNKTSPPVSGVHDKSTVDDLFTTWFTQNRHLVLSGHTLAEHITNVISAIDPSFFSSHPIPTHQPSYSFPPISPTPTGLSHEQPGSEEQEQDSYLTRFHDIVRKKSRKLLVTTCGYIGVAPCSARLGDVIAILFGCSIPLVLRRSGPSEAWTVVGEVYVDGFMNGEVERLIGGEGAVVQTLRLV